MNAAPMYEASQTEMAPGNIDQCRFESCEVLDI